MEKTDSLCIKMYKKTPHSCFSLNWFQIIIWHKVHFMNTTAAIFDFNPLEVANKNATQTVFDHYGMLMQNQVEIHL